MANADKLQMDGVDYDIASPTAVNDYVETIGEKVINPNGYTAGSFFLAKNNDVQYMYKATAALTYDSTVLTVNTNCVKTNIGGELVGLNEALNDEVEIRSLLGAKNILPTHIFTVKALNGGGTWSNNIYSYRGVTFNCITDSEGLITRIDVSGTNTSSTAMSQLFLLNINEGNFNFVINKELTITGCPSGGSSTTYCINCFRVSGTGDQASDSKTDIGNGYTFTWLNDGSHTNKPYVSINIYNSYAITGTLSFYPMLRLASDADPTYQPFAYSNYRLTGSVFKKVSYEDNGKLGAKNLIVYPYDYGSQELNGITFIVNDDGSITFSGTASSNAYFMLSKRYGQSGKHYLIKNGKYYLNGCTGGNYNSTYFLGGDVTKSGASSGLGACADGDRVVTINGDDGNTDGAYVQFYICVRKNAVISTPVTIKPMLRLITDLDPTYQPYAMTNQQLTTQYNSLTNNLSEKITQAYYDAVSGDKEDTSVHTTAFESMIPTTVGSTVIGLIRYANGFFSTCIITRNKNNEANAIEFNPTSFLSGKHTAMWIGGLSSGTWTWTLKYSS